MLEQVLATDVDDECDIRSRGGNVGEVLLRSDADIDAAASAPFDDRGDDVQVGRFIGNEVVPGKMTGRFGERGHDPGEFGQRQGVRHRPVRSQAQVEQDAKGRQNQKSKRFQCRGVSFSSD